MKGLSQTKSRTFYTPTRLPNGLWKEVISGFASITYGSHQHLGHYLISLSRYTDFYFKLCLVPSLNIMPSLKSRRKGHISVCLGYVG